MILKKVLLLTINKIFTVKGFHIGNAFFKSSCICVFAMSTNIKYLTKQKGILLLIFSSVFKIYERSIYDMI